MKTNDLILQTTTKIAVFIILLFSLHIFFAGHYYPGGGFVGGLLTSGALVLLLLAFDIKTVANSLPFNFRIMIAIGLLFAIGTGAGALFFNVPFLTHAFDYFNLPLLGKTSLHTAVLFDIGVYLCVVGATMTIIQTIGGSE
ncbi:Na(+)/H(+) antiporter subunit B [Lederbergia galactosidilytica]|uniref:Monovalent cation/H+ antiporter subunit B n=1 Tax=Lederbergia galactosidilytica TaxID=217031 RepID=A0A177ZIQ6_9BACI|nr:Na(+)/H(+) antiporter subunit B [Lederbergia galactosidilytica]KRG15222.1 monovalent cation/H+ antiporter subunit B [Virgibacillus soli]OAK67812.1 monovalent cation/H+ antiporter subunit B [Lederbergia galactosidilytica]